jgi:hypothetical protein
VDVVALERSLVRWRIGLAIVAIALPLALFALFERQARRLDALGERGVVGEATVTHATEQYTDYAYDVAGQHYTWNVARHVAPYAMGETFAIVYVPDDPALNRPGKERARGTEEAAANRSFARKVVGGVFAFLAFNLLIVDVRLRRLRLTGKTEHDDPTAYRTRLVMTGIMLFAMLAGISGWHAVDAREKGESVVPVVLGAIFAAAIIAGTWLYVLRHGRAGANERAARIAKIAFPIVIGIALLRAIAWMAGW